MYQRREVATGFYMPGSFVALTHDGERVAHQADDGQRIKVFDIRSSGDRRADSGKCEYTLQHGAQGDIFFVGTNRLFAVGDGNRGKKGKAAAGAGGGIISYWDLDSLEKHQPLTFADTKREDFGGEGWLDLTDSTASDNVVEHPERIDVRCGDAATGIFSVGGLETSGKIYCVTPVPGGQIACGAASNYAVNIVDLQAQRVTSRLHGHTSDLSAISFWAPPGLPEGNGCCNVMLTACQSGEAKLWDLRCAGAGALLTLLPKTLGKGTGAATLAGEVGPGAGAMAFTGGSDQGIRCWDLRAARCMYVLSTVGARMN
jgi:WD40 repeat protein